LGIWVVRPSIAQRILWGLPLTAEDEALSAKRGVRDSVAKGVLPFPIPYEIERECMGFKRTYAEIVASAATGTTTPIITESPLEGEFLVLESVSADSVAADLDDNTQLYITAKRYFWGLTWGPFPGPCGIYGNLIGKTAGQRMVHFDGVGELVYRPGSEAADAHLQPAGYLLFNGNALTNGDQFVWLRLAP
ncbi:unnamed protein product, partial [marine sediment metagenome]